MKANSTIAGSSNSQKRTDLDNIVNNNAVVLSAEKTINDGLSTLKLATTGLNKAAERLSVIDSVAKALIVHSNVTRKGAKVIAVLNSCIDLDNAVNGIVNAKNAAEAEVLGSKAVKADSKALSITNALLKAFKGRLAYDLIKADNGYYKSATYNPHLLVSADKLALKEIENLKFTATLKGDKSINSVLSCELASKNIDLDQAEIAYTWDIDGAKTAGEKFITIAEGNKKIFCDVVVKIDNIERTAKTKVLDLTDNVIVIENLKEQVTRLQAIASTEQKAETILKAEKLPIVAAELETAKKEIKAEQAKNRKTETALDKANKKIAELTALLVDRDNEIASLKTLLALLEQTEQGETKAA